MIKLLGKIPQKVTVACSGGPDSMAVLDFCLRGNRNVEVAFYNHGDEHSDEAQNFLEEYCKNIGVKIRTEKLLESKPNRMSWEAWWRHNRYNFLDKIEGTILTGHNLDDAVETWVFGSLHGQPKLIPYRRGTVIRPFLLTKKSELVQWCDKHGVGYLNDPMNRCNNFARSIIRHEMSPLIHKINPGISTVIYKKLIERFENVN